MSIKFSLTGYRAPTDARRLKNRFDAVVILTMGSNWKTEPRSNRYHYATRFARHLPVLFAQMTGMDGEYRFEDTEIPNLTLLHLPPFAWEDDIDSAGYVWQLGASLRHRKILRPLLWIYDVRLAKFLRTAVSGLSIFHATEDYTLEGPLSDAARKQLLRQTLMECDGIVTVSEAVRRNYERFVTKPLPIHLASNGCDYTYFTHEAVSRSPKDQTYRAIYQGGINFRIDLDLLLHIATELPHWEFRFLGNAAFAASEGQFKSQWNALLRMPNVKWLGQVDVVTLREEMSQATVGLIPFRQMSMISVSLPLKAYEYVACGLPVVTVPIDALQANPAIFCTAANAAEFATAMERVAPTRYDPDSLLLRDAEARANSYDAKFHDVIEFIEQLTKNATGCEKANVLVLLSPANVYGRTRQPNFLTGLRYSRHDIRYLPVATGETCCIDMFDYDAVVLCGCANACHASSSHSYLEALAAYAGLKVLIHDEQDPSNAQDDLMEKIGVHLVYTNLASDRIDAKFSPLRFGKVEFVSTISGYDENSCRAMIEQFDAKLQEYGVGTRPRPLLPAADWYIVIEEGAHGYRTIKASEANETEKIMLPYPPTLKFWGRCKKSLRKNITTARRVWQRLPQPAKVLLYPPWHLARFTYRCVKSII